MATFDYRRRLTREDLGPAIGAGVGAGIVAGLLVGYVTQIMLRRTPLQRGGGSLGTDEFLPPSGPPPEIRVVRR